MEGEPVSESARRRVEAALAIAHRPTTLPGERDAAIAGAMRLIGSNNLDPDDFDIPGRARTKAKPPPASRFSDDLFRKPRAPEHYTRDDLNDVLRRFHEHMRASDQGSYWGDSFGYAADALHRRQQREHAERQANEARSRATMDQIRADLCVSWLWKRSPPVRVYGNAPALDGSRRWVIPGEAELEYTDAGVIEVAERHGWGIDDTRIDAAVAFLRARGIEVVRLAIPGLPPQWRVAGDVGDARQVIFSARLRGFEE